MIGQARFFAVRAGPHGLLQQGEALAVVAIGAESLARGPQVEQAGLVIIGRCGARLGPLSLPQARREMRHLDSQVCAAPRRAVWAETRGRAPKMRLREREAARSRAAPAAAAAGPAAHQTAREQLPRARQASGFPLHIQTAGWVAGRGSAARPQLRPARRRSTQRASPQPGCHQAAHTHAGSCAPSPSMRQTTSRCPWRLWVNRVCRGREKARTTAGGKRGRSTTRSWRVQPEGRRRV